MRLLPDETTADARVLLTTRAVRAFVDGLVAVALPAYLVAIGFNGIEIGAIVTATLVGSAALTLLVGLRGHRLSRRWLLRAVAVVMIGTGIGFGLLTWFWPLIVVAVLGTLNPSSGDVSVFLPAEQALLPSTVSDRQRTALYGRYSLVAFTVAAAGSLAAGLPDLIARTGVISQRNALRAVFAVYTLAGVVVFVLYRHLSTSVDHGSDRPASALGPSRRLVYRLSATFGVDALGGGFVVQSLLVLWLYRRFHLSTAVAGAVFFWAGLLSGFSALVAVRIAARLGLVRTMVFTHLPANVLLILTALAPNAPTAIVLLLARSALSQMDVPTRTSYVMAVVRPEERAAAASVTNVPRSLAAAATPFAAGWLLDHSTFGWPLILGGALKAGYDLLLLAQFHDVRPPEEVASRG